ncbi:MAG: hypothetical protein ABJE95_39735 [Byssovorax sp.]
MAILRKWEIDVGQRVGWRSGLRITKGFLGARETDVELEVRVDSLADLEAAWRDMEHIPHHADYLRQLGPVIVERGSRWIVVREAAGLAGSD